MKTINQIEAYNRIIETLENVTDCLDKFPTICFDELRIQNIDFVSFFLLFNIMKNKNVRLYMPGELKTNECMVLRYTPAIGINFHIESELCVNYKFKKINTLNLN